MIASPWELIKLFARTRKGNEKSPLRDIKKKARRKQADKSRRANRK